MNPKTSNSLTAIAVLSCFFAHLLRADVTLSVGNVRGAPGTTVAVPVQLVSDESVAAAQFDVVYDPTKLSVGPATGGNALVDHAVKSIEPTTGIRRIVIYSLSNAAV